jgi:hypothetical protein
MRTLCQKIPLALLITYLPIDQNICDCYVAFCWWQPLEVRKNLFILKKIVNEDAYKLCEL